MNSDDVVIVSATRTAIGTFGGMFAPVSAIELGTAVVRSAIEKAGIRPEIVDQVIMGNVLSAGLGQNVARQIQIRAGVPQEKTSFTVSKVCGSGLKAIALAVQSIQTGESEIVVAGGAESMSNAAYALRSNRWGAKMGHVEMQDTMISDGLTDAFSGVHMGITAENLAEKFQISRETQDAFSARSQQRACAAIESGRFVDEITPITVHVKKQDVICATDEFPRAGTTRDGLAKLRPAFKANGTVTAGNASGLNDGAAAVVLMRRAKAVELGLQPMATILSHAVSGVDPQIMGYAPVEASRKALARADLSIADLSLIEANEAFASQAISVVNALGLNPDITNVNGGAIALGHPIGASGARILVTLVHELIKRQGNYGLATLCIGGGQGIAMVIQRA
jgi:acetyl-CoA C-acetyltransferase